MRAPAWGSTAQPTAQVPLGHRSKRDVGRDAGRDAAELNLVTKSSPTPHLADALRLLGANSGHKLPIG